MVFSFTAPLPRLSPATSPLLPCSPFFVTIPRAAAAAGLQAILEHELFMAAEPGQATRRVEQRSQERVKFHVLVTRWVGVG